MKNRNSKLAAPREDARIALIEVAERLFAEYGIEGVSLRSIAREGGFRNNVVVQYHFGDKRGLVAAIFQHRLPRLDSRRAELLEEVEEQGGDEDPLVLVDVLLRPIAELVDRDGNHSYAAFLFSLQQFDRRGKLRMDAREFAPLTNHIVRTLRNRLPEVDDRLFGIRTRATYAAFFSTLMYVDRGVKDGALTPAESEFLVDDAIDLAAMGICKPLPARTP